MDYNELAIQRKIERDGGGGIEREIELAFYFSGILRA